MVVTGLVQAFPPFSFLFDTTSQNTISRISRAFFKFGNGPLLFSFPSLPSLVDLGEPKTRVNTWPDPPFPPPPPSRRPAYHLLLKLAPPSKNPLLLSLGVTSLRLCTMMTWLLGDAFFFPRFPDSFPQQETDHYDKISFDRFPPLNVNPSTHMPPPSLWCATRNAPGSRSCVPPPFPGFPPHMCPLGFGSCSPKFSSDECHGKRIFLSRDPPFPFLPTGDSCLFHCFFLTSPPPKHSFFVSKEIAPKDLCILTVDRVLSHSPVFFS